eukprot:13945510-Alexandrium_andersonii.AAC.1
MQCTLEGEIPDEDIKMLEVSYAVACGLTFAIQDNPSTPSTARVRRHLLRWSVCVSHVAICCARALRVL